MNSLTFSPLTFPTSSLTPSPVPPATDHLLGHRRGRRGPLRRDGQGPLHRHHLLQLPGGPGVPAGQGWPPVRRHQQVPGGEQQWHKTEPSCDMQRPDSFPPRHHSQHTSSTQQTSPGIAQSADTPSSEWVVGLAWPHVPACGGSGNPAAHWDVQTEQVVTQFCNCKMVQFCRSNYQEPQPTLARNIRWKVWKCSVREAITKTHLEFTNLISIWGTKHGYLQTFGQCRNSHCCFFVMDFLTFPGWHMHARLLNCLLHSLRWTMLHCNIRGCSHIMPLVRNWLAPLPPCQNSYFVAFNLIK